MAAKRKKRKPKLFNNKHLRDIIENEGIEYTFVSYLSHDEIEDPEIRKLAKIISDAFAAVEDKLGI